MALTFRTAKEQLAQYAGRGGLCPDDVEVGIFVKEVLQYLLYKGPTSALRTYCFSAKEGCITLPYELEVPLKVRIDDQTGSVWSGWFKYYDTSRLDGQCYEAANALVEEPNHYPTVYQLPKGGSQVGVMGTCREEADAHLIVKGVDVTGREIFTVHKGEQVSGEYLSIIKDKIRYTGACFGRIDSVVKSKTNGYAGLFAIKPEVNYRQFLADYSPLEEIPQYRRFRLTVRCKETAVVSVLGRIRLKENYADSDVIPIDNIYVLNLAAQGVQLSKNNDFQGAQIKDAQVTNHMTEENQYKKVSPGQPLDCFQPTSPGSIRGIISGGFGRRGGGWW